MHSAILRFLYKNVVIPQVAESFLELAFSSSFIVVQSEEDRSIFSVKFLS